MIRYRRRFIAFLLAIFMVNALAWSFNAEVLADATTHQLEAAKVAAGTADHTDVPGTAHHHPTGQTCNHGCHAAAHLQGQISEPLSLFTAPAAVVRFTDESVAFPTAATSGPYRPPRLSSLA
jgi:hypothetical protein